jgi:hypothetical protein
MLLYPIPIDSNDLPSARRFPSLACLVDQSDDNIVVAPSMKRSAAKSGVEVIEDDRTFPYLAAFSPTLAEVVSSQCIVECGNLRLTLF